mmetsp:Transcript_10275/g.30496  ORF Transcript_10275/g.30496 Transcript_10275/m.30496 type:complete len:215 (+) Transcript_10275:2134-2778(+)
MTVRNCEYSTNSSRPMTPLPLLSKIVVKRLHFSRSTASGCASLRLTISGISSSGSSVPLPSASSWSKLFSAWSRNSSLETCSTSQSGRKGMMLQSRSLSSSTMEMNSWNAFSSICATSIICFPSSLSRKPATMTNWTRPVNSLKEITPSSFASNMSTNFLHCSSSMTDSLSCVRRVRTGIMSMGCRVPLPSVSSAWNWASHSAASSSQQRLSRR